MGRIIRQGFAKPDTGCPGIIGGFGRERVVHAPVSGVMRNVLDIGDIVAAGETIAWVQNTPVNTAISGILRGIIRDGFPYIRE